MATEPTQSRDPGFSLAMAMVLSSTAPLLLLDGQCTVIAVSASFCRAFNLDPAEVSGREFFVLGHGEWDKPQLRSLFAATISGDALVEGYEMDLERPGQPTRSLSINVQELAYGSPDHVRLLVSVGDLTDARTKDRNIQRVLQENEVLVQEVRHRIANSLQIIASVLMQNARRSQSAETRSHLRDAHQRVMSVAELQQQLAASTLGTVRLRAYLVKLAQTIAASMIADPNKLSIAVDVEDVVIDAAVSVSMGLIVTELVINSLKHGFPGGRGGVIRVSYHVDEPGWELSVSDDGVGMPTESRVLAGLGTTIVQALARQLGATVTVSDGAPGTRILLAHDGPSADAVARSGVPEPAV